MRATAIVGPADVGRCLARFHRIEGVEWTSGLEERADAVVIFGGDGTVHRHLSALVDLNLPVLVVPCGSGNDFARALGLRSLRDSVQAWQHFVANRNNCRTVDLGLVRESASPQARAGEAPAPRGLSSDGHPLHYFCCIAGVGLDAEITRRANELPKWIRAHGGYALCAPREFFRFFPFPMKITYNNGAADKFQPTILTCALSEPWIHLNFSAFSPRFISDDILASGKSSTRKRQRSELKLSSLSTFTLMGSISVELRLNSQSFATR